MEQVVDVPGLLRQIPSQYPFVLIDSVVEHDPVGGRLVCVKNVTGAEEYFEGHFPGAPVMPGVLLMESLAQAGGIWILKGSDDPRCLEVHVVGIDAAKFRRPVLPGDQLRVEVTLLHRRGALWRFKGEIHCGEHRVAEARLLLQLAQVRAPEIDATARVDPRAVLAEGVRVGAYSVIGPEVTIGRGTVVANHVTIMGPTSIGADNHVFPYASIGLAPQDLKFKGERTMLAIGDRNHFREFVTIHRGTGAGTGLTRIGSDNLFMAYAHVAHDCVVGSHTIFANGATLAGHVEVHDYATIGAFSGVHQFCRVGAHAFIGGYTVATKDVLPYSKTVGNRARLFGVNSIGLVRRGFSREAISAIRAAYRKLFQSHMILSVALAHLERDGPHTADTRLLIAFIRSAKRGVVFRRRRAAPDDSEPNGA